jgi:hypothetical protein
VAKPWSTARIGDYHDLVAGGRVPDRHGDAGNRGAAGIDNGSFDDAGRGLGLREKRKRNKEDNEGEEHEG